MGRHIGEDEVEPRWRDGCSQSGSLRNRGPVSREQRPLVFTFPVEKKKIYLGRMGDAEIGH